MSERFDLVVVGAGVMGLSIAYQTARRSDMRILVLERGVGVGEGSSGQSAAILRQRYSRPEMIRMARDGLRAYLGWPEFTGIDRPRAEVRQVGVLWVQPTDRAAVEADAARLLQQDVVAEVLDRDDLHRRFPALADCVAPYDPLADHEHRPGDAFLYEPEGGYTEPVSVCQDLLEGARRVGVDVRFRSRVTGIEADPDGVRAVMVGDERFEADRVVNAAGPWCNQVLEMVGLELPWTLQPTRVQVLLRDTPHDLPGPIPVTGDIVSGVYLRPEAAGQQILFGSVRDEDEREPADPDDYDRGVDPEFVARQTDGLHHRIPTLPRRGRITGYAGLYTVNLQDVHPVIGPTALPGFYVANGFSGHGFKIAPMVGSLLAQHLTGVRASFDTDVPIGFFAVDRDPIDVAQRSVLA